MRHLLEASLCGGSICECALHGAFRYHAYSAGSYALALANYSSGNLANLLYDPLGRADREQYVDPCGAVERLREVGAVSFGLLKC